MESGLPGGGAEAQFDKRSSHAMTIRSNGISSSKQGYGDGLPLAWVLLHECSLTRWTEPLREESCTLLALLAVAFGCVWTFHCVAPYADFVKEPNNHPFGTDL